MGNEINCPDHSSVAKYGQQKLKGKLLEALQVVQWSSGTCPVPAEPSKGQESRRSTDSHTFYPSIYRTRSFQVSRTRKKYRNTENMKKDYPSQR